MKECKLGESGINIGSRELSRSRETEREERVQQCLLGSDWLWWDYHQSCYWTTRIATQLGKPRGLQK